MVMAGIGIGSIPTPRALLTEADQVKAQELKAILALHVPQQLQ